MNVYYVHQAKEFTDLLEFEKLVLNQGLGKVLIVQVKYVVFYSCCFIIAQEAWYMGTVVYCKYIS